MILLVFWLILKLIRWGDNFEWYVKLGSWEELQIRLDRLTSAIVVDKVTTNEMGHDGGDLFPINTVTTQSPLNQQRRVNDMPGFDLARDSGYNSPHGATGPGARPDIHEQGNRTPSPRAPVPSVRSYDQRLGMGSPPLDQKGAPIRRRPVGASTTIPTAAHQHAQQHQYYEGQQYQLQPMREEPVMMGEQRRPTYGSMLQPGWGGAGHAYDPVSPSSRGVVIEHEYNPASAPPRGGNMDHGYGAASSLPRDRHNVT